MVGNRRFGRLGTAMLPVKALDTLQPIYGLAAFVILIGLVVDRALHARAADPADHGRQDRDRPDLPPLVAAASTSAGRGSARGCALGPALVAAIAEPFSFQLLRHAGAVWGWIASCAAA